MEKEEGAHHAHVLVVTMPIQGHINPMLHFSKRLHSKGLRVTLAISKSLAKSMHAQTGPLRVETFSDGYDNGFQKGDKFEDYFETFRLVGSESIADLIKKQESLGDPITCVVYDSVFPRFLDVAKKLGLIAAAFFTQSCAVSFVYYHVQQGLLTVPVTAGPINSIPGLPLLAITDLPSFVSVNDGPYAAMLTLVVSQFCNIDKADWILFNSFDKLEQEVVNWMATLWPVKTIGPTVSSIYHNQQVEGDTDYSLHLFKPVTDTCLNWLNMRETRSVVYVSFGSLAELRDEQMKELASALKESNNHFMWKKDDEDGLQLNPNPNPTPRSSTTASTAAQGLSRARSSNLVVGAKSLVWAKVLLPSPSISCNPNPRPNHFLFLVIYSQCQPLCTWRKPHPPPFQIEMEKEEKVYHAHVLAITLPGQGHINPMLQFSKKLHSKGLRVTLAITRSLFKTMQAQTGPIRIETFSDGYDNGFQKEDKLEDYFESVKVVGSQTLTDLIKKQESLGDPITCVLYDSMFPWALDVAKQLGLTAVSFVTQSCAVSIIYYYIQQGLLTVPVTAGPVNSIHGFPLLEIADLPSFVSVYDGPYPMLLTLVINQFRNVDKADWILFNSFDKLEQEIINLMAKQLPVKTIGPTVSSIYHNQQVEGDKDYSLNLFKADADTCLNWLNMRETESVVYVSFGSIAEVGDEKMIELASALKESNNYFMWVAVTYGPRRKDLPSQDEKSEHELCLCSLDSVEAAYCITLSAAKLL
ncbi:hypothetical protein NE237_025681 [Protea cynaroides]|uniref:Uncharacterized protein n=1 Tax=Protea cynaroides TaxID=273540 RepID=A0A9Q0H5M5_9MAGN|nr:hypothetical protein NE237_025681 [Protea cynaroides]